MLELSAMATLDTEDMRVLTRSALGPGVGESSSEAEQEARNFSRTSYVIEDPEDDVDDEITAVFNDETEEAMTRSDMQAMFDDVQNDEHNFQSSCLAPSHLPLLSAQHGMSRN